MIEKIRNLIAGQTDRLRSSEIGTGTHRAWIEIDLKNLEHNVRQLKFAMPDRCELMAVVKAEAYGHGALQIAAHLQKIGIRAFAVATIDEGIHLRHCGITGEILILGYTSPSRAKDLRRYDLIQTLVGHEHASAMNAQGIHIRAHIKIDTGMHRLGFDAEDFGKVSEVFHLEHLHTEGIYTHLCVSDSLETGDVMFTRQQIDSFRRLLKTLSQMGIALPKTHIQSSYGLLNYPDLYCDYVRAGIALYGVYSTQADRTEQNPQLRPVLSLRTRAVQIKDVPKGECVGYGRAFTAHRDTKIAVLSIGYADGVPRDLSCGKGSVLIAGQRAPIIGRICMDQLAVDVTDIPGVKTGMTATVIGREGDLEITAEEAAFNAGTITNEILSRLGQRLPVVVTESRPEAVLRR